MAKVDVKVPDIGDFKDVPVIEVLVKAGDVVKAEQSLISLESDKATMDVPSPVEGTVAEVLAKVGDKVSMGTLIARVESGEGGDAEGRGSRQGGRRAGEDPSRTRKSGRCVHPEGRLAGARQGRARSTSQSPTSATSTTSRSSRSWSRWATRSRRSSRS